MFFCLKRLIFDRQGDGVGRLSVSDFMAQRMDFVTQVPDFTHQLLLDGAHFGFFDIFFDKNGRQRSGRQ